MLVESTPTTLAGQSLEEFGRRYNQIRTHLGADPEADDVLTPVEVYMQGKTVALPKPRAELLAGTEAPCTRGFLRLR